MQAEVVLRGGPIYTMDATQPPASCLAIAGGRILASGGAEVEELRGPHTRVIDLRGRAVVPGFVDAHIHFGSYALTRGRRALR
jgi:predicted amidohydrolase YtcJ